MGEECVKVDAMTHAFLTHRHRVCKDMQSQMKKQGGCVQRLAHARMPIWSVNLSHGDSMHPLQRSGAVRRGSWEGV